MRRDEARPLRQKPPRPVFWTGRRKVQILVRLRKDVLPGSDFKLRSDQAGPFPRQVVPEQQSVIPSIAADHFELPRWELLPGEAGGALDQRRGAAGTSASKMASHC